MKFFRPRNAKTNPKESESSVATHARRSTGGQVLTVLGPFRILVFVFVLFALMLIWRDLSTGDELDGFLAFISLRNLKIILAQTVIVSLCALGMTMIIVSGGIDLSVGSVVALTSVLGAVLIRESVSLVVMVPLAILAGGLVGAASGALVAGLRMTPFIVTLGMLGVARGLAKWLSESQAVNFPPSGISWLMRDPGAWVPAPGVFLAVVLAVIMAVIMRRTVFGRYVFAIGSNEATAQLCGIRTQLMKGVIYTWAGLFFGLAGLVQLSRLRQGDPTAAVGLELDTIAAVVIGGASLSGGSGSILGSMVGALAMAVLRTGSQYMDWPTYMQEIIIGLLIIFALGLDKLRQSRAAAG